MKVPIHYTIIKPIENVETEDCPKYGKGVEGKKSKPASTPTKQQVPDHSKTDDVAKSTPVQEKPTLTCVTYIASVLTMCAVFYLVYLTHCWRNLRLDAMAPRVSETCVGCRHLRSTDTLQGVRQPGSDSDALCCGNAGTILDELIAKYTEQKFEDESRNRLYPFSFPGCNEGLPPKATAKVSGISHTIQREDLEDAHIHWNTTAFQRDGLKYVNGSIEIANTAIYYASFQVMYSVMLHKSSAAFRTRIIKQTRGSTNATVLLESLQSPCNGARANHVTAASGAIYKLAEGDKVLLSTSHPEQLNQSEEQNFFTIYNVQ